MPEKKAKKSSREAGKSKEKDRKSRDKKSSTKKKTSASTPVDPVVSTPPMHDPDAIQLFRRYDRNRTGVLTRLDFLQLLKDYADPKAAWGSRPPLSLTDSSGIPLGYERAERNSEFEAGQLFERYDKAHTGALTVDSFHVFFNDFKPQLRAFVEESNYRRAPAEVTVAPAPLQPIQEEPAPVKVTFQDAATGEEVVVHPKALRAQYRTALWSLRKLCKEELLDQREAIVQQMQAMRDEVASRHPNRRRSSRRRQRADLYADSSDGFDSDNDANDSLKEGAVRRYEALEEDLDRLDGIVRCVRRYLHKGDSVSTNEMQDFVDRAERLLEEAQSLAMKEYGTIDRHETNKPKERDAPATVQPAPWSASNTRSLMDLEGLLRVKDQMIYQLLQERTSMRKERAAVESSLRKLSDVSTREMKKWARLTDDMQAEIEQLRAQLRAQSTQRTASA